MLSHENNLYTANQLITTMQDEDGASLKDMEKRYDAILEERNLLLDSLNHKTKEWHESRLQMLEDEIVAVNQESTHMNHKSHMGAYSEEMSHLQVAMDKKTAELEKGAEEHASVVKSLESDLLKTHQELKDMKQAQDALKAAFDESIVRSDTQQSEKILVLLQQDFIKIQKKYVEKRAEVETLHIGLDTLLEDFKSSQNEDANLVELLKSRDELLLKSVSMLEEKKNYCCQIRTLENGIDSILQELTEVKREKDELQTALDKCILKHSEDSDYLQQCFQDSQERVATLLLVQKSRPL